MSTNSSIGIYENGNLTSIYCHWDGYLSHNGKILKQHYTDIKKIRALMALGSISSLDVSIECPDGHTFDDPLDGFCVAYHRDRGEDLEINTVENITFDNVLMFMNDYEYNYLYDADQKCWLFADEDATEWTKL